MPNSECHRGMERSGSAPKLAPGSIPNRVDLPQKILPLSGPTQLATTSASLISIPPLMITLICHSRRHERDCEIARKRFISKLADSSASVMVRNTSFPPLPFLGTNPLAGVFTHFPDPYSPNSMGARAIWARRVALHKRINHNQHKRREKGPRRGHSRTFYPRAARSRSPFRPTSQVEHHQ